jgi:acetyl esterase
MPRPERLDALAIRALAALPPRVKRVLAGPPTVRDGLQLDVDAQLVLKVDGRAARPPLQDRTPAEAREDMRSSCRVVSGPPRQLAEVGAVTIAGAAGRLPARLYVPHEAEDGGPLIVFFHGGGWVVGDLDTHDAPCRLLAHAAGMRVLAVEYRLAPEHRYPAPVDDAIAAFRDAAARADELRIDASRIAVAGDSAGGHLATMVALATRDGDGPAPAFQALIYPATDFVETHPSARTFAEGFLLTKANMDWYEAQFVPDPADKPAASPLRAPDLSGAAPALIVTAGFDPLRDEGEAYAARLREAGVRTILRRHPDQIHGFFNLVAAGPRAREAISEIAGVLRAALG